MKKIILAIFILIHFILSAENKKETIKEETKSKINIVYPAKNKDNYSLGKEWKLLWADEFDGEDLNMKNWTRQIMPDPYNGEWEQYVDHKENSYVENGYLVLKAIHTSKVHADKQYTSARLHTGGKQTWKYGRIAARIQLPYGQGIWPAFWMLGANIDENGGDTPWPKSGEIDILELYGSKDNAVVEANIHYNNLGHKSMGATSFKLEKGIFAENFHIFELEWNKEEFIWYVDGEEYCRTNISDKNLDEFHKEFFILLNLAVGGNWAKFPDSTTIFPQTMYVDWVRVYKKQD